MKKKTKPYDEILEMVIRTESANFLKPCCNMASSIARKCY